MEIIQLTLPEALKAYPKCRELRHGPGGGMSMLHNRAPARTVKHTQAFVALRGGIPIGWAWAIPTKVFEKRALVSFSFVDRSCRREGVGYSLYCAVRKFATSRHRSLFLDHGAYAINTKNKCDSRKDTDVMRCIYDAWPQRSWDESA